MSWNGSSSAGASVPAPKKPAKKSPELTHGLIAGAAIVLIGIIALYFIGGEHDEPVVEKKGSTKIAEAEPEIAANVPVKANVETKPLVITNYNSKGVWYDDAGRPHYKPARIIHMGSNTVINGEHWVPPRKLFNHMSELELDRVLSARLGDRIVGETNWRFFEKDLQSAMIEPIKIEPEDTPEEIARKEAVRDAKKELAAAIGNGESASKILKEAQDDLNSLANIYDNLNKTLAEVRASEELTEQEIDDYIDAANQMLESNNIITKRFLKPSEIREKAEAAKERRRLKQLQNK